MDLDRGLPLNLDSKITLMVSQHIYTCPINLYHVQDNVLLRRDELIWQLSKHIKSALMTRYDSATARNELEVLLDWDLELKPMVASEIKILTKYAILSHRWGENELRFEDMQGPDVASKIQGSHKISNFLRQAEIYECTYAWFDTACINKSSSTELEESIRSMFTWYRNAEVCIVYLADTEAALKLGYGSDPWFERGWTLQELLAPRRMKFYNQSWTPLSYDHFDITRGDHPSQGDDDEDFVPELPKYTDGLMFHVSYITGIDLTNLLHFKPSVERAQLVMTWAASRQTTRPEDIAYCLIGLLDATVSIAYGEGRDKAFYRLQVDCIQRSGSRNLLAWNGPYASSQHSMVANDPVAFKEVGHVPHQISATPLFMFMPNDIPNVDPSVTFTNYGLRIALSLYDVKVVSMRRLAASTRRVSIEMAVPGIKLTLTAEWKDIEKRQIEASWKVGILGAASMKMWNDNYNLIAYPILIRNTDVGPPPRFKRLLARFDSEFSSQIGYQFNKPVLVFVQ